MEGRRSQSQSSILRSCSRSMVDANGQVVELPPNWFSAFDSKRKKMYYYNKKTREKSWKPPPISEEGEFTVNQVKLGPRHSGSKSHVFDSKSRLGNSLSPELTRTLSPPVLPFPRRDSNGSMSLSMNSSADSDSLLIPRAEALSGSRGGGIVRSSSGGQIGALGAKDARHRNALSMLMDSSSNPLGKSTVSDIAALSDSKTTRYTSSQKLKTLSYSRSVEKESKGRSHGDGTHSPKRVNVKFEPFHNQPLWRGEKKKTKKGVHLLEKFLRNVYKNPNEDLFGWIEDNGKIGKPLTYELVWTQSTRIARKLKKYKCKEGDRVILCYHFGLDFIVAFIGCLLAKVIPVPIYPPNPARLQYSLKKMNFIVDDSKAVLLLTHRAFSSHIWSLKLKCPMMFPSIKTIDTDSIAKKATQQLKRRKKQQGDDLIFTNEAHEWWNEVRNAEKEIAFLQYTSGSTGDPKGVIVSFENLSHNLRFYEMSWNFSLTGDPRKTSPERMETFSWLPQYHDLGLIGCYLLTLWMGGRAYFMSPFAFLKNPMMWPIKAHEIKANRLVAANFAYGLVATKWNALKVPVGFNLARVKVAESGGEDNIKETMLKFEHMFEKHYGLRKEAIHSDYGLAECTLGVGGDANRPRRTYSKQEPNKVCCAVLADWGDEGHEVRVVDAKSRVEMKDGQKGEIWIHSKSVCQGYWNKPKKSEETFRATLKRDDGNPKAKRWLRTGDLGYIEDKKYLFFASRIKDILIVRGKNYYPRDIEVVAESVKGIRPGCCAVFGVRDPNNGTDCAVLVAEVREEARLKKMDLTLSGVSKNVCTAIFRSIGLSVSVVLLLKARTIPKTSSGKIRRNHTRDLYLKNNLKVAYRYEQSQGDYKVTQIIASHVMDEDDPTRRSSYMSPMDGPDAWEPTSASVRNTAGGRGGDEKTGDSNFDPFLVEKKALSEVFGEAFDWGGNAEVALGEMLDSMQLARISGLIRETFDLDISFEALMQGMTTGELLKTVHHYNINRAKDASIKTRRMSSPGNWGKESALLGINNENIGREAKTNSNPSSRARAKSWCTSTKVGASTAWDRVKAFGLGDFKLTVDQGFKTDLDSNDDDGPGSARSKYYNPEDRADYQPSAHTTKIGGYTSATLPAGFQSELGLTKNDELSNFAKLTRDAEQKAGGESGCTSRRLTLTSPLMIRQHLEGPGQSETVSANVGDPDSPRDSAPGNGIGLHSVTTKKPLRTNDIKNAKKEEKPSGEPEQKAKKEFGVKFPTRRSCCTRIKELIAIISFFLLGSACAIPSYHLGKWAIDLDQPWGYIHVGIYDDIFGICSARIFGVVMVQVVSLWALMFTIAVIGLKWILIGRYHPGVVELDSSMGKRWWYVDRLMAIWESLIGIFVVDTIVINLFYNLLGAHVAWSASISEFFREMDLVTIREGASVSGKLMPRLLTNEYILFDKVVINSNCKIRDGCVVEPGVSVGKDSTIEPLSRVSTGSKLTPGIYIGNPIHRILPKSSDDKDTSWSLLCEKVPLETVKILTLICLPHLLNFMSAPAVLLLWWMDPFGLCIFDDGEHLERSFGDIDIRYYTLVFLATVWVGSVLAMAPFTIIAKWVLAGHVRVGEYTPTLFTRWRRWFLSLLANLVTRYTFQLLGSLQVNNLWMRMLGMKFGKHCVSINFRIVHIEDAHLVTIGNGCFLSACTLVCDVTTNDGRSFKCPIRLGDHTSIGFRAIVEGHVILETWCALGWLTYVRGTYRSEQMSTADLEASSNSVVGGADAKKEAGLRPFRAKQSHAYLGHHIQGKRGLGICLLQRKEVLEVIRDDSGSETSETCFQRFYRLGFTTILLALSGFFLFFMYMFTVVLAYELTLEWGKPIEKYPNIYTLVFGIFVFAWGVMMVFMQAVHKWLTVYKFRTAELRLSLSVPICQLLRTVFIQQSMNISLTIQYILGYLLHGTSWAAWYLRMMGADVSETAIILTSELLFDFDLIKIGHGVVLDHQSQIVGHNFAGFRLRHGETKIGDGAIIGPYSYIQCGNHVGRRAKLLALSKVLTGEIGDNQTWGGIPAKRMAQGGRTIGNIKKKLRHSRYSVSGSVQHQKSRSRNPSRGRSPGASRADVKELKDISHL